MKINTYTLAKGVVMTGIGLWLLIAVLNNITDMDTNLFFVKQMVTMSTVQSDPILGKGLLWRAVYTPLFPNIIMCIVIFLESIAAILLIWSGFRWFKAINDDELLLFKASTLSNVALTIFIFIWMWFLGGDLWFGYWIKRGAFAGVHSVWIMISLLLFIFINIRQTTGVRE
jgi:predicted small integral membrane protein